MPAALPCPPCNPPEMLLNLHLLRVCCRERNQPALRGPSGWHRRRPQRRRTGGGGGREFGRHASDCGRMDLWRVGEQHGGLCKHSPPKRGVRGWGSGGWGAAGRLDVLAGPISVCAASWIGCSASLSGRPASCCAHPRGEIRELDTPRSQCTRPSASSRPCRSRSRNTHGVLEHSRVAATQRLHRRSGAAAARSPCRPRRPASSGAGCAPGAIFAAACRRPRQRPQVRACKRGPWAQRGARSQQNPRAFQPPPPRRQPRPLRQHASDWSPLT